MTWVLLLLAVFLFLGVRAQRPGRKVYLTAMVISSIMIGYAYIGLGKVH
jgi:bacteriorhodopsin